MSKKILGLDIGSDAVTAALVVSGIKGARLAASIRLPFQEEEDTDTALQRCLETIHHSMDLSGAVCVAALPAAEISFRNIRLPFQDDRKIRQVLPFEVEPILPGSVEDVVIDFQPISANGAEGPNQVITAAVDQARMKAYLDAFSAHGLEPEVVTIGGYVEAACLLKASEAPGCWFHVSLAQHRATVSIVVSGAILLVRRLEIKPGKKNGIEDLCRQIDHARLFCENLNHALIQPDVVYWTGQNGGKEEIEKQFGTWFQCHVEKVDFQSVPDFKWATGDDPTASPAPEDVDRALALTLVELTGSKVLNFRRGPFALRKQWLEYKGHFLRTAALLLVVLLLGFFQLYSETRALDREVQDLQQQTRAMFAETFPDVKRIVDPVQQMRVELEEVKKQVDLAGASDSERLKIDLLQSLSSRVPPDIDVEITRLVIGTDSMVISGDTSTFNAVDEIKSALEKDPLFDGVTINSANLEKSGERVNFKLRIGL